MRLLINQWQVIFVVFTEDNRQFRKIFPLDNSRDLVCDASFEMILVTMDEVMYKYLSRNYFPEGKSR